MRAWLSLAAWLAMAPLPAHAERDPQSGAPIDPHRKQPIASPLTDHFYVEGLFFDPSFTTRLRVDPKAGVATVPPTLGTVASAEQDLGLDSRVPQGRIELMIRMRERNKVRVDYFESDRRGDQVLSRPIQFGDQPFAPGDRVTSSLDWRSFTITYTYSFIHNDRFELGAGLAAHFLEADARGAVDAKQLRQEVSGSGAFPTIPLDFAWRISRRFAFTARAQYFRAKLHNFEGSVGDYHADFQYRWKPNFALGAGYTDVRTSLDLNQTSFPGMFRFNVRGPEAFIRVSL